MRMSIYSLPTYPLDLSVGGVEEHHARLSARSKKGGSDRPVYPVPSAHVGPSATIRDCEEPRLQCRVSTFLPWIEGTEKKARAAPVRGSHDLQGVIEEK